MVIPVDEKACSLETEDAHWSLACTIYICAREPLIKGLVALYSVYVSEHMPSQMPKLVSITLSVIQIE
jgi:hypothetical protein